ncbi:hypothetical protein [Nocardioides sp. LML1-1-1.1]|uniref:hypothetical protein n=1 Tax=Nocardioides sp. LML1-1-1.1 TaxID=3135248 RepID=UPI00341500EF
MSTTSDLHLYVGGVPLEAVAAWGDPEITWGRHGPLEMSWEMALGRNERPDPLARNAFVELCDGIEVVWSGVLSQPDWDSLQFQALGIARLAEGAECLAADGTITSRPDPVLDQGIARGVLKRWYRAFDFGSSPISGPDGAAGVDNPQPGKVDEMLNDWSLEDPTSRQWYVHPSGLLTVNGEDETKPQWYIAPGIAQIGVADDDVTDRVFVRYFDSSAGRYRDASYPSTTPDGGVEKRADITHRGAMTAARATTIAQGIYNAAGAGRVGFTNGVEVSGEQLRDAGNHRANYAHVWGGHVVQAMETTDPRGGDVDFTFVLEETRWRPADDTTQLNPVGLVARTWEQVLEEADARG